MTFELDVVGIGNALVDVLDHKPHDFIALHGLAKGTMTLIDEDRAHHLYQAMEPALEMSGGSAANTMVGIASLGGSAAYIGRVCDDQLGKVFAEDLRATGVEFSVPPAPDGPATGRCVIVVTPDAQRTMNTCLGASTDLAPEDVDPDLIARAKVVYLEGYLWDRPSAKEAFRTAARLAHAAGRQVALTLSDPFCIGRHRESFVELIDGEIDVLFANEEEITSLFEVASFDEAVRLVRGKVSVAALTRSVKGSVIISGDEVHAIDPFPVSVTDTTGAGDMYAAGFLHGLAQGWHLQACGRLGSAAAARIISQTGARPRSPLAPLIRHVLDGRANLPLEQAPLPASPHL
ncbi:MAG TPA: adenosine kinase [Actinomycetes bacterium]|jgi:sugar/nucleoside kinase (ribokinase family)|nr:adenosine kinase [Actinomycetes bacterium]